MSSHHNVDARLSIPVQDLPIYRRATLSCFAANGLATLQDLLWFTESDLRRMLTEYYMKLEVIEGNDTLNAEVDRQVDAIRKWASANGMTFHRPDAPKP